METLHYSQMESPDGSTLAGVTGKGLAVLSFGDIPPRNWRASPCSGESLSVATDG